MTMNNPIHSAHLRNKEEFSRLKARKERVNAGLCATCGRPEDHDKRTEFGTFTHQWDNGLDARMFNEHAFLDSSTLSIIRAVKEMVEAHREWMKQFPIGINHNEGFEDACNRIISSITSAEEQITNDNK